MSNEKSETKNSGAHSIALILIAVLVAISFAATSAQLTRIERQLAELGGSSVANSQFDKLTTELTKLGSTSADASFGRWVPYFRDGESLGMRIFAIPKQSPCADIGLLNGDIIQSIDGHPVTAQSNIAEVCAAKPGTVLKFSRSPALKEFPKPEEQTLIIK